VADELIVRRPHWRYVALGALLVLVIVAAALAASGRRSVQTDAPFGPYVGYRWQGHVVSVEGSWFVPQIRTGSGPGEAATWIGAQAPGAGPPFIQVGVYELRRDSQTGAPETRYWAFWTDTSEHFHPQLLFRVRPRDELAGSLVATGSHWTIAAVDRTSGAKGGAAVNTHAAFNKAEWLQGDMRTPTGELAHYPSLTPVAFRHIAVNRVAPSFTALYYACMSISGTVWVPSRLRARAFVIRETSIAQLRSARATSLPCRRG
jgi:peptidase A4-like protein